MPADLGTIRTLLVHTDWSNDRLLDAAAGLGDEPLDRDMQIGGGGLRRTMLHIFNGEHTWLRRWQGGAGSETPWPSETEAVTMEALRARFAAMRSEREWFLLSLEGTTKDLSRMQTYRDSKGSLFRATLADMLIQGVFHSKHHQAQAANLLRRIAGVLVELDYMERVRQAAPQ
jgi:uncharacterized damage-inducible protein DinB